MLRNEYVTYVSVLTIHLSDKYAGSPESLFFIFFYSDYWDLVFCVSCKTCWGLVLFSMFAKSLSSKSATSWVGEGLSDLYRPSLILRRTDASSRCLSATLVKPQPGNIGVARGCTSGTCNPPDGEEIWGPNLQGKVVSAPHAQRALADWARVQFFGSGDFSSTYF